MLSTESLIAFSKQSTHHAVIDGNSSHVWENAGVLEANLNECAKCWDHANVEKIDIFSVKVAWFKMSFKLACTR